MTRKVKKEKVLTPEEKFQQALVPGKEQPYKVPENWCWVRLGKLGFTNIGLTYKPKDKSETGIIVLRSSNIQDGHMDYTDIVRVNIDIPDNKMSKAGDILICARNGSKSLVGKTAIIDRDGMSYGAFMAIFRSPFNRIIYYYLNSHYFRDIIDKDVGTTTINQVTQQIINELPFPFPPINEQHRIVARIESLFAKLDEAKEKAQAVVDGFEDRKAAILHKAFTGELTAEWRKKTGLPSWKDVTSSDLFEYVTSGSRGWAQYYSDCGPVFIRMGNLDHGTVELDWSDIQHVTLPDKAEGQRSLVKQGDILISITADVGMIGLIRDIGFEAYINQHVALARPVDIESAEFIAWYLVSDVGLSQLQQKQRGATKVGLGLNDIRSLDLQMPCKEEQLQIVDVVKSLIEKEFQAKDSAEQVISQIDTMKKSILARAFRGQLGTNDPSDEIAEELLKQII